MLFRLILTDDDKQQKDHHQSYDGLHLEKTETSITQRHGYIHGHTHGDSPSYLSTTSSCAAAWLGCWRLTRCLIGSLEGHMTTGHTHVQGDKMRRERGCGGQTGKRGTRRHRRKLVNNVIGAVCVLYSLFLWLNGGLYLVWRHVCRQIECDKCCWSKGHLIYTPVESL